MTQKPDQQPPDAHLEDAERNDEVIGVAFRRSLVVIVLIVITVLTVIFWPEKGNDEETVIEKDDVTIIDNPTNTESVPTIAFTDISDVLSDPFIHVNGAVGDKLLPETMGGGVALFDYDNDGDADLFFVNSMHWPWDDGADQQPTSRLYRNDGADGFTDVTDESGAGIVCYGMGCAIGDIDNDGWTDLYVTAVGENLLLRNDNGVFVDVTATGGVAGGSDTWSSSAGFFDMENDGDLDLFVCNYVQWSRDIDLEVNFQIAGIGRAYGPPKNFAGSFCELYRNEGDGRFTNVTETSGVAVRNPVTDVPAAKALAVTFADLDHDGLLDILVANDTTANFLLHNKGDGSFEDIGASAGVAFDRNGNATGAMGIDATHPLNDDTMAISIGNFAREETSFYMSQRSSLMFADMTSMEGIGAPSRARLSFGLLFLDLDLDGWPDLLQANGHLEEEITIIEKSQHYEQPVQVFRNKGADATACYAVMPDESIGDLATPLVGRGAACADIDGDGDLDVVITQPGRAPHIYRNDQDHGHHWLRVHLTGTKSNRDAIGAIVEVTTGDVTMRQTVMPTRSYLSQTEMTLTFGLGTSETIDSVRVIWPSGAVQDVTDVRTNETLAVTESVSG